MEASTQPTVGSNVFVHWRDGRRLEACVVGQRRSSTSKRGGDVVFTLETKQGEAIKTRLVHLEWGFVSSSSLALSPLKPPPPQKQQPRTARKRKLGDTAGVGTAAKASTYRSLCRDATRGDLFCSAATACCFAAGCVCCAYKLVVEPTASALSAFSTSSAAAAAYRPNRRPEQCLREANTTASGGGDDARGRGSDKAAWSGAVGGLYGPLAGTGARVLTVGDGDLSFSVALAETVPGLRLVASTHLTRVELEAAYGAGPVVAACGRLAACGAAVAHGVDATRLHEKGTAAVLAAALGRCTAPAAAPAASPAALPAAAAGSVGGVPRGVPCFDRVVWNFPCVAGSKTKDADAQLAELATNQGLLRRFFGALVAPAGCSGSDGGGGGGENNDGDGDGDGHGGGASMLARGWGEVHVAHKAKPPFGHWDIAGCAAAGAGGRLRHSGACVFDRSGFPGYEARKVATGSGSFPTWDAKVYMWSHDGGGGAATGAAAAAEAAGAVPPTLCMEPGGGAEDLRAHPMTRAIAAAAAARDAARRQRIAERGSGSFGTRGGSGGGGGGGGMVPSAGRPLSLAVAGPGVLRLDEPFLDAVTDALRL